MHLYPVSTALLGARSLLGKYEELGTPNAEHPAYNNTSQYGMTVASTQHVRVIYP